MIFVESKKEIPTNYYEEGFKGTGLYSDNNTPDFMEIDNVTTNGKLCPVCTLINTVSVEKCQACDSLL